MLSIKSIIQKILKQLGYELVRIDNSLPVEAESYDDVIWKNVRRYTMTGPERIWSLISSVRYVVNNNISGDIVECGVWRGGSSMASASKLIQMGNTERVIWLYDTFEGMTPPSEEDYESASGVSANSLLEKTKKQSGNNIWCIAGRKDVERNIKSTNYPVENIRFVQGDITKTLSTTFPGKISILRLDTDWYESTKKELEVLYPRLVSGGVCIIDDYGHWAGARKAVDEYLKNNNINVLLHRIDSTARIFIKP